jgi:hypothetical protein
LRFQIAQSGWSFMPITNKATALPNEQRMPESQKHTFEGFYTIACLKKCVIETARDIARQYFDNQSLRRRHE